MAGKERREKGVVVPCHLENNDGRERTGSIEFCAFQKPHDSILGIYLSRTFSLSLLREREKKPERHGMIDFFLTYDQFLASPPDGHCLTDRRLTKRPSGLLYCLGSAYGSCVFPLGGGPLHLQREESCGHSVARQCFTLH